MVRLRARGRTKWNALIKVVFESVADTGRPVAKLSAGAACDSSPAVDTSTVEAAAWGLLAGCPGPVLPSLRPRSPLCNGAPEMPSDAYADTLRLSGARGWRQIRPSGCDWSCGCNNRV
jgi:hypothetical protein